MTPDKSAAPNADTSEDEVFEMRWPEKGDRLFMESTWAYDARVVRDPKERFYRMPMGYKRAGDLLIDQASADVVDRSNVIYAALFCYRQAIELYLKSLIAEFGENGKYAENHNLKSLWNSFKDIVNERGTGALVDLCAVESLIVEMHKADERSTGFRYPATKVAKENEAAPFDFGDRGIDLPNIREVMQGLANFFECTSMEFSHRDDFSSDQ